MRHLTKEKCGAAQANERICTVVGKLLARFHMIDWNLPRPPAIGCDESRRNGRTRQNPFEILGLKVQRASPKLLLISNQVFQKWRKQSVLRISARLQPIPQPIPRLGLRGRTLIGLGSRSRFLLSRRLLRCGARNRLARAIPRYDRYN